MSNNKIALTYAAIICITSFAIFGICILAPALIVVQRRSVQQVEIKKANESSNGTLNPYDDNGKNEPNKADEDLDESGVVSPSTAAKSLQDVGCKSSTQMKVVNEKKSMSVLDKLQFWKQCSNGSYMQMEMNQLKEKDMDDSPIIKESKRANVDSNFDDQDNPDLDHDEIDSQSLIKVKGLPFNNSLYRF